MALSKGCVGVANPQRNVPLCSHKRTDVRGARRTASTERSPRPVDTVFRSRAGSSCGRPDGCGECCGGARFERSAEGSAGSASASRLLPGLGGGLSASLGFGGLLGLVLGFLGLLLGDRLLGCRRGLGLAAPAACLGLPLRPPPSPRPLPRAAARRLRGRPSIFTSALTSGKELDRDLVAADALDRLRQVDLPPVDADLPRAPDLVGDVRRGHRAEERALRAGVHLEAKHRLRRACPRSPGPARSGAPRGARAASSRFSSSATSAGVACSASRRGAR